VNRRSRTTLSSSTLMRDAGGTEKFIQTRDFRRK
jgi:hypothetical protein